MSHWTDFSETPMCNGWLWESCISSLIFVRPLLCSSGDVFLICCSQLHASILTWSFWGTWTHYWSITCWRLIVQQPLADLCVKELLIILLLCSPVKNPPTSWLLVLAAPAFTCAVLQPPIRKKKWNLHSEKIPDSSSVVSYVPGTPLELHATPASKKNTYPLEKKNHLSNLSKKEHYR